MVFPTYWVLFNENLPAPKMVRREKEGENLVAM